MPSPPLTRYAALRGRVRGLIAGASLAEASDYLSFVGRDRFGHVALAVDTNRGRDGEWLQAEHL